MAEPLGGSLIAQTSCMRQERAAVPIAQSAIIL